ERQRGRAVNAMAKSFVGSSPTPGHQPSRRGLLTGLVSFLAAPAIVRAASLDGLSVLRGVPLVTELEYNPVLREIALGYMITRHSIEHNLLFEPSAPHF